MHAQIGHGEEWRRRVWRQIRCSVQLGILCGVGHGQSGASHRIGSGQAIRPRRAIRSNIRRNIGRKVGQIIRRRIPGGIGRGTAR